LGWALERYPMVQPIYVRFGLRWERAERYWLKKLLKKLNPKNSKPLVELRLPVGPLYGKHWSLHGTKVPGYHSKNKSVYLPGRNIRLLSETSVFCASKGIETIFIGTLKGNPFPDAGSIFFRTLARSLSLGLDFPIRVKAPFQKKSKKEVLGLGKKLPLELTFSCLNPSGIRRCGRCNKCAERDTLRFEKGIKIRVTPPGF